MSHRQDERYPTKKLPVTVAVMVLNEEKNLPELLRTVMPWAADVVVVDSFSTDATMDIAKRMGARVYQHQWEYYAAQNNWTLDNVPISTPWVLWCDADDRVTPALASEIARCVCDDKSPLVGYYVNRRVVFLDRPIMHNGWYPNRTLRLFKYGCGRFEDRKVHERFVPNGPVGYLKNDLIHDDLRSLHEFVERHNRYSTTEAEYLFSRSLGVTPGGLEASLTGDWAQRRRFVKERIWQRLPARPLLRFIWMYIIQRGFLDGMPGFIFAVMISYHEFVINAKLWELRHRKDVPASSLNYASHEREPNKPL